MAEHRAEIYTCITVEIVAAIEAGAGHYRMPRHHNGSAISRPANVISERRYRSANVLALWIAVEAAGYPAVSGAPITSGARPAAKPPG